MTGMRWAMGIEGGGSKCDCLIADEEGRVVGCGRGGPTNPWFVSRSVVRASIGRAVRGALNSTGSRDHRVAAVCGFTLHSNEILRAVVEETVGAARLRFTTEEEAVRVELRRQEVGVVIIAGTGSNTYGRNRRGERANVGGWGQKLGDEGSGSDIGRQAVRAAIRSWDGRGRPTELEERVVRYFGVESIEDLKTVFYLKSVSRHKLSGLAEEVAAAARQGDGVARGILAAAGRELGIAACALIRRLRMEKQAFEVILSGGLRRVGPLLFGPLRRVVKTTAPRAEVVAARHEPVVGALQLALQSLGRPIDRRQGDEIARAFEERVGRN